MKTQDPTILVRPNNDDVRALLPSMRRHFWKSFFQNRGIVPTSEAIVVAIFLLLLGSLFLFSYSFVFRLSTSFMSKLVLVILLLQRPGVINIFSLLTYSLYPKNLRRTNMEP
jgi:hypothetical protein